MKVRGSVFGPLVKKVIVIVFKEQKNKYEK